MRVNDLDGSTTWGDLTAGLTAELLTHVERMGAIPSPWTGDELTAILYGHTREFIRDNRRDA